MDEAERDLARWEKRGDIDRAYRQRDPATWRPLRFDDGSVEEPPQWFLRKVACPPRRSAHRGGTVARPAVRRRSKASRAGPDDDPHEPGELLAFAREVASYLKAYAGVIESFHRDLGGLTPTAYEGLIRELYAIRRFVHTLIEAERVAEAVGE